MIKYGFYILAGIYSLYLIFYLVTFTRTAPAGDAIGWSRNIFYSAGLFIVLVIGLLFWKKPNIGFIILCVPLAIMAYPIIRQTMTDLYAVSPTLKNVKPLTLTIQNTTPAIVHVQLSCWFGTGEKGKSSLYKTMDYTIGSDSVKDYSFTQRETNLLAAKSKFVTVMMYEQIKVATTEATYLKEIQPCMQYYDENIDAFANGNYTIVIDSSKNSKTFREEVAILKKENRYEGGSF